MTIHNARWLLVALARLALWPAHALAQGGEWEGYMAAGRAANQQGNYAEAEPFHNRALAIAKKALGPDHPDVAHSLENHAVLLRKPGRDTEAEKWKGVP